MNRTLDLAVRSIIPDYTHVLEFGVWTGGTIRQLRNSLDERYEIFGFDSFEGLPEDWVGTRERKGAMSLNGEIPVIEGVTIFAGWFTDTIPKYREIRKPIALLHCDADLYSSTVEILYGVNDCIVTGTIIVFDEWFYNHNDIEENRQHEQKAFYEWAKDTNRSYELVAIEEERMIVRITS